MRGKLELRVGHVGRRPSRPARTGYRKDVMPSAGASRGLTNAEIMRIVNRYIGVSAGYLGDFTYATLRDFYPEYCDLDIDPFEDGRHGTMRVRFLGILQESPPDVQAKIVRGVIERYPVGSSELRTASLRDDLLAVAERLERGGMVAGAAPVFTSDVVLRAIDDAETLLQRGGPTSAVDRMHTALHGHLRYLCDEAGIHYEREATMVALLRMLRREHPSFQDLGPRGQDIERVLNASGSILDVLNPVRNTASVAHPNEQLLGRNEAQLVVNVGRSLITYIDSKVTE